VSFAKSLRRHQKDFFPLDVSTSVLDGRMIRRCGKHNIQTIDFPIAEFHGETGTWSGILKSSYHDSRFHSLHGSPAIIHGLGKRFPAPTKRLGSVYGSGRKSTALTTLKIAVVAPMARPRMKTATNVNPGLLANVLKAYCRSFQRVSTATSTRANCLLALKG